MANRLGIALLGVLAGVLVLLGPGPASAKEPRPDVECHTSQPDDGRGVTTVTPSDQVGESITGYAVDIELRPDGSARFTETIDYDFGTHSRHGIFRDLITRQRCNEDHDRVYPFDLVSVASSTGAPSQVELTRVAPETTNPLDYIAFWRDGNPTQRIRIGEPNRTITGQQTYEIVYDLDAVSDRAGDGDQLYWNVIGNGWSVPITGISVSVRPPTPAASAECFAGPTGSTTPCTSAEVVDGTAIMTQDGLGPGENLTVRVAYPRSDTTPRALFDDRWSLAGAFSPNPVTVGAAVLLMGIFVAGFVVLLWRVGRDEQAVGSHVDVAFASGGPTEVVERKPLLGDDHAPVEFVPPDDIRPGQAGLLIDERVHPVDVTATIVDLAVRGFLVIDEIDRKLRKNDYELTRTDKKTDELLRYEEMLLRYLVASPGSSVKMSDLKYRFADDYGKVERALYEDARLRRWFHGRPDKTRARWKGIAWLVILLGLGALVTGVLFTHVALLAVPLLIGGILLRIGSRFMPRRTAKGTGLTRRLRGFEEFIQDSEAVRARWAEDNDIFSEYLPYAIVFRCADKWAAVFEDLGVAQELDWYHGNDFRPLYVSSSMSSFATSASGTLTASASSGSSGGGGGGFSGGGGGGGGGGSW